MRHLLFIVFICVIAHIASAQTLHSIKPSDTDPNIDAASNNHYVYINTSTTQLNKLLVFFPGTGAAPSAYTLFLKEAANLGYHTIGLDYPNPVTINSVCGSSTDTTCFKNARLEVFDGKDRNATIQVNTSNCIKNRLLKVLKYLDTNNPSEHWSQYYTNDTTLNWDKIALSGHSQGGGHAGIISKYYAVDRVIMFGATDWMNPYNKPANWIKNQGLTPANRYYGFTHTNDELVTFSTLEIPTWNAYGMYVFGSNVSVDTLGTPYANSHTLTTNATPALSGSTQYHNACSVSIYTPKDGSNNPVYAPVWDYLLTDQTPTSIKENQLLKAKLSVYPNPAHNVITVDVPSDATISIINALGQSILFKNAINGKNSIDISLLPRGIYHLSIHSNEDVYSTRFIKE